MLLCKELRSGVLFTLSSAFCFNFSVINNTSSISTPFLHYFFISILLCCYGLHQKLYQLSQDIFLINQRIQTLCFFSNINSTTLMQGIYVFINAK